MKILKICKARPIFFVFINLPLLILIFDIFSFYSSRLLRPRLDLCTSNHQSAPIYHPTMKIIDRSPCLQHRTKRNKNIFDLKICHVEETIEKRTDPSENLMQFFLSHLHHLNLTLGPSPITNTRLERI